MGLNDVFAVAVISGHPDGSWTAKIHPFNHPEDLIDTIEGKDRAGLIDAIWLEYPYPDIQTARVEG